MRIEKISVRKLFGLFDHDIDLKVRERITIIFGPNGFGKTVLLTLVDALFNARYAILRSYPFQSLTVGFDTGTRLSVIQSREPHPAETVDSDQFELRILSEGPVEPNFDIPITLPKQDSKKAPVNNDGRFLELLKVFERDRTFSRSQPRQLGSKLPSDKQNILPTPPPLLEEIYSSVPVHFIQTQRLQTFIGRSQSKQTRTYSSTPAVETYSKELVQKIAQTLAVYASESDQLDRSFPRRLVRSITSGIASSQGVDDQLNRIGDRRKELTHAGLLDATNEQDFEIGPNIDRSSLSALSMYLNDVEAKYKVFDSISAKIELLKQIVAELFLFKELKISREDGFVFTAPNGSLLSLNTLSSGEQHELVMLYELLFRMAPKSLVLIDEPEMSLHVAWQSAFLRNLAKIASVSDFDVLIATHSPEIISDRWDLTVELKRPFREKNA
jgi:predicted ATP-binding protein involved in virulence